jgi:uncharacterized membrane protein YoaT (DUF817 family)
MEKRRRIYGKSWKSVKNCCAKCQIWEEKKNLSYASLRLVYFLLFTILVYRINFHNHDFVRNFRSTMKIMILMLHKKITHGNLKKKERRKDPA